MQSNSIRFSQLKPNLLKALLLKSYKEGYLQNSFWTSSEVNMNNLYLIYNDNSNLGLVQISLGKHKNGRKYANIEMIELFSYNRHYGLGKVVVGNIFKVFKVHTLFGEAIPSAIPFWYSIGADFELSKKKLEEYIEEGYYSCFRLTYERYRKHCLMR